MSKELLLEIGTEEMPANIMAGVTEQLRELATKRFEEERIDVGQITIYATPRRLAVLAQDVAERQPDEELKKRGPSLQAAYDGDGNPTKAAMGFARSLGIEVIDLVQEGDYTWAETVKKGKAVEELLPDLFRSFIMGLNFARSMRWADEEEHFIRPVRWLVALCDEDVIPMDFAHVQSGRISRGHRFLCKDVVEIARPSDYKDAMRKAFVIVDQDERRQHIVEGLLAKAKELGGEVWHNEDLLEEINYLVEYPTALYGRIDEKFLALPVPAVVTPMREHQRYYPVRHGDGTLMPYFLTVRNGGDIGLANVRVGNERVLRARLEDAKFFFDGDRKKSLEAHRQDLTRINYQEGLGNLLDKADRLRTLTATLVGDWNVSDEEKVIADRAAYLSKSDLATGMVREFTELQGEMGMEYALLDGETKETARAIFEQYMPRFAGDILPESMVGRALSLADKLDNLAATFLRGLIPTGSQDPFALRRQTIGAIHILIDGKIHWNVRKGIEEALSLLPDGVGDKDAAAEQIEDFFRQRIKAMFLDKGFAYDIVDAVLADDIHNVYALFLKAESMVESKLKDETDLRQAVTRLANITKGKVFTCISPELFEEDVEKELYQAVEGVEKEILLAYEEYRYGDALPLLQGLTAPVNAYLDTVMVMVDKEEVRNNRVSLLLHVLSLYRAWGDMSKLV